jgi:hypothetical protein
MSKVNICDVCKREVASYKAKQTYKWYELGHFNFMLFASLYGRKWLTRGWQVKLTKGDSK